MSLRFDEEYNVDVESDEEVFLGNFLLLRKNWLLTCTATGVVRFSEFSLGQRVARVSLSGTARFSNS